MIFRDEEDEEDKENYVRLPKKAKKEIRQEEPPPPTPKMKREDTKREPNHNVQQITSQDYLPTGALHGFSFMMKDDNKTILHLTVVEARKLDEYRCIKFVEMFSLYKHTNAQWMLNQDIDKTKVYSRDKNGKIEKIKFIMRNNTSKIVTIKEATFMDGHRVRELKRTEERGWQMQI